MYFLLQITVKIFHFTWCLAEFIEIFYILFKSDNPTGEKINTLGKYLLTSLLFVMSAILEFAAMLFLQRKNELKNGAKVSNKGRFLRRGSFEMKKLSTKIDGIAMILYVFAYLVFNIAYWIPNLSQL